MGSLAIYDQLNSTDSQTCSYAHDDLGRIASANCGTLWSQTFSYDAFGNISKTGSVNFAGTGFYSPQTNQLPWLAGFTYDADGNMLADTVHNYTWDAEGHAVNIDSVNLTYDALGRMVEQQNGSSYQQIVYGPEGSKLALMNGQSLVEAFIPLPGGGTAVYGASGLMYYRHADWLGSSRLASTPARTVYYDGAYAPFGESYAEAYTIDRSFTGQNQDTAQGLYDFLFREYSGSQQGRWISPDPAGMRAVSLADPQTWNRYAYVGNRPLNSTDHLGLWNFANDTVLPTYVQAWYADTGFGDEDDPFGCQVDRSYTSCAQQAKLEASGAAVNCPQCKPGQNVDILNQIWGWTYKLGGVTAASNPPPPGYGYAASWTMGPLLAVWGVVGAVPNDPFGLLCLLCSNGDLAFERMYPLVAAVFTKAPIRQARPVSPSPSVGQIIFCLAGGNPDLAGTGSGPGIPDSPANSGSTTYQNGVVINPQGANAGDSAGGAAGYAGQAADCMGRIPF